jgi:hypothetical protein
MSSAIRRGGIPGPESRTALTRPSMTEAEFERRIGTQPTAVSISQVNEPVDPNLGPELESSSRTLPVGPSRTRNARVKATTKPRRVQRMFAIEEDLDKKLWLYAIHLGKDRSEVINDLLRPIVASMVLYDSRDRRGARNVELAAERGPEADGDSQG